MEDMDFKQGDDFFAFGLVPTVREMHQKQTVHARAFARKRESKNKSVREGAYLVHARWMQVYACMLGDY